MTWRNRVTPRGELIAVPDRGMFWGNRGCIHDSEGNIVRYSRGRAWAICVLEYKDRRRKLMAPGRLTELFFLDEATGLAAGHRPCGECRVPEYRAFRDAWTAAHGGPEARAPEMDRRMHEDRLSSPGIKRVYPERIDALPDGTMIEWDRRPWLLLGEELLAWGPGAYGERRDRPHREDVSVLTPRSTVAVLQAGYQPVLHQSARSQFP
jgi:hypothetical protein